jgi:hypothetical protein
MPLPLVQKDMAQLQLVGVLLGLAQALAYRFTGPFGLHHGHHAALVFQHVVRNVLLVAPARRTLQAAQGDDVLAAHAAALHHAPARLPQRGIDQFGTGFGFVHFPTGFATPQQGIFIGFATPPVQPSRPWTTSSPPPWQQAVPAPGSRVCSSPCSRSVRGPECSDPSIPGATPGRGALGGGSTAVASPRSRANSPMRLPVKAFHEVMMELMVWPPAGWKSTCTWLGHHAPSVHGVALAVEVEQGVLHQLGHGRLAQDAAPVPGIEVGVEALLLFGVAQHGRQALQFGIPFGHHMVR